MLQWQQILGQKVHCYICISRRDNENMMTYITGGFVVSQSKTFLIARSKGCCQGNQILAKIGNKSHKKWPELQLHATYQCRVWFGIGFQLSANSPMTLPYTRRKGALPWQPILTQNCYKCHEVLKEPHYYLEFI